MRSLQEDPLLPDPRLHFAGPFRFGEDIRTPTKSALLSEGSESKSPLDGVLALSKIGYFAPRSASRTSRANWTRINPIIAYHILPLNVGLLDVVESIQGHITV